MELSRLNRHHQFVNDLDDSENSPENSGGGSPRSAVSSDTKTASTSSSRRSRRAIQKRVVSVPIKDVEGLRMKTDHMSAPPSDSWAWRKYGQKPIKGSPYPRGYYRCSSSKGCPARKQVERSREDPNMLLVTYYCEHNHNYPASRNSNNHHKTTTTSAAAAAAATTSVKTEEEEEEEEEEVEMRPVITPINQSQCHDHNINQDGLDNKFTSLDVPLIQTTEFGWFSDLIECTLESPMLSEEGISTDNEMAMIFTMREEDESLFADLGELPECSTVFRRGVAQREAEQRRPSLATTS